ncbi:peptidoglycan DD-metalloendopeptidase family protein [Flavobacterium sp. Sd200]|uniref:M23 family metallopeptidase n=1 Tax=Flavobacterium sp. Sd200 TaxID=2692211 RepID=UPI00136A6BCF|nr:M23 family metallopeptidase [Flavobacterium sp. Sd200]MXN90145.1 peptidoglycan DD-metalloendopeptidase family protein [Flavobacterium sp. Sd200]
MATKNIYLIAGGTAALIIIILLMKNKKVFTPVTKNMKFRGYDPLGSGAFGAHRSGNTRKHSGVDVLATPGQDIFAPISGTAVRVAYPYKDDLSYTGILIKNAEYEVKMFYLSPTVVMGKQVTAGQKIGVAQNITAKHGAAMQNHVHFEVRNSAGVLIDPTNMFNV